MHKITASDLANYLMTDSCLGWRAEKDRRLKRRGFRLIKLAEMKE